MNCSSSSQPRSETDDLWLRFGTARERGEPVDIERFCAEHPEHAVRLRELWRADQLLHRGLSSEIEEPASCIELDALLARLRSRGRLASRYRIDGELGRGGMGVVYAAFDEDLGRRIALKTLRDELSAAALEDPRALARFLEEAQVTGQLEHPSIVPVYELGIDEHDRVYYTMQLVEGETLARVFEHARARENAWTRERAVGALLRVCEAVALAHSRGVLHRDLKPSNVMVGPFGQVYVMDWGLARVLSRVEPPHANASAAPRRVETVRCSSSSVSPELETRTGHGQGTPSYMAPELTTANAGQHNGLCDVYALGAMLYELLAGHAPYRRPGKNSDPHEILRKLAVGPPEALGRDVPSELIAICERAMARDPERRHATVAELATDLRAYLEGRVVPSLETGNWAETRKWVQRNRLLATSLAATLVALSSGIVISLRFANEANFERAKTAQTNAALRLQSRSHKLRMLIQDLARLRAQCRQLDGLDRLGKPAYLWWIEESTRLVEGQAEDLPAGKEWQPGLDDVRAEIAHLRVSANLLPWSEEDRQRDITLFPDWKYLKSIESDARKPSLDEDLAESELLLQLSALRLGRLPWPADVDVAAANAPTLRLVDSGALLDAADGCLGSRRDVPDSPEHVILSLLLVEKALPVASPNQLSRAYECKARALSWMGRHAEAEESIERALAMPALESEEQLRETAAYMRRERLLLEGLERVSRESELDSWVADFTIRKASAQSDNSERSTRYQNLIDDLEQRSRARRTWRFLQYDVELWHAQLMHLEAELEWQSRMLAAARDANLSTRASHLWDEAIEGIARSRLYSGQRWPSGEHLTPQLGLLPIGENPVTGLWEFVHLQSGTEPRLGNDGRVLRDAEGDIALLPESGIVFILLPGGRVPRTNNGQLNWIPDVELEPFFLSKYEMTNEQWYRLALRRGYSVGDDEVLWPVNYNSWVDVQEFWEREIGWCSLPSEAQWEYGCRAGTSTRWWTGDDALDLHGAAVLDWQYWPPWEHVRTGMKGGIAVTSPRANPWGLCGVYGGVAELCGDTSYADATPRTGDGLRDDGPDDTAWRVVRGGSLEDRVKETGSSIRSDNVSPGFRSWYIGIRPSRSVQP